MPVMDGLEAVEKILEMGVKTPIVALTANIMSDALELYENSGIADTVGKPFTAKELWRCLIKYFPNENVNLGGVGKRHKLDSDDEIELESLQRIFVQGNADTYDKLKTALETSDFKTAHRLVHSLKSNAGYIKEAKLQETCGVLESLLMQDHEALPPSSGLIAGYVDDIKYELDVILAKLAHLPTREVNTAKELDPADSSRILELFGRLQPLLESKRTNSLEFADDLRDIPGLYELSESIRRYDFKAALQMLISIKNIIEETNGKGVQSDE
jgi:CheY-like chemotaxis protein